MSLSREQTYAFEKFKKGENLFITGPGGTGKTRLIHTFITYMEENHIGYQVCALTGCATVLIGCGARTLHSWSGIKLGKGPSKDIIKRVIHNKHAIKAWKSIRVLIIDEVSMMSKKVFDLIEEIARIIKKKVDPFGSLQVIFTGDFYQLPPVGDPGDPESGQFAFESERWSTVFSLENHIQLATMFRQKDPEYIKILGEIREGSLSKESHSLLSPYIGREFHKEENYGVVPTKLFAIKSKVDFVNNTQYGRLVGEEVIYSHTVKTDALMNINTCTLIEPRIIAAFDRLSPEEVTFEIENLIRVTNIQKKIFLKVGSAVMCTFNIDIESGICNGSQGTIVDFKDSTGVDGLPCKLPIVLFSNGSKRIIKQQQYQSDEYPSLVISQIPLCLSWALTIHKIQGATLQIASMDLGSSIFEFGQIYVALSRIQSLDGLFLHAFEPSRIKANPKVKQFYRGIPEVPSSFCHKEIVMESSTTVISSENIFESFAYEGEGECKKEDSVIQDPTIKKIRL
jgi:ATP-dependent DNA helicase PIF1